MLCGCTDNRPDTLSPDRQSDKTLVKADNRSTLFGVIITGVHVDFTVSFHYFMCVKCHTCKLLRLLVIIGYFFPIFTTCFVSGHEWELIAAKARKLCRLAVFDVRQFFKQFHVLKQQVRNVPWVQDDLTVFQRY